MTDDHQPKNDPTPDQNVKQALANLEEMVHYTHAIVAYRRALYLEYIGAGFTEEQALNLIKGQLI